MPLDKNGEQFEGELRMDSAPPTKTGWYYGGYIGTPGDKEIFHGIKPRYVLVMKNGNNRVDRHTWLTIDKYRWFGPVTEVREA